MGKQLKTVAKKMDEHKDVWFPYAALSTLGYAFYNIALRFVPIDFDDLGAAVDGQERQQSTCILHQ